MPQAIVQLQIATGSGPTLASAESPNGFTFNREDTQNGTTNPVPVPSSGTNFSFLKWLALVVTTAGTTSITNRAIQLSTNEPGGLAIFFRGNATYAQATGANQPASSGSTIAGGALPAGFTRATTSSQNYDTAAQSTSSTGRNGNWCELAAAADSTYGGVGTATMPDIRLSYVEA